MYQRKSPTDWTAGILACMSAKHENITLIPGIIKSRYAVEATALQARMPAVQSVDAVAHRPFVHSIYFFESNFFPVLPLVI